MIFDQRGAYPENIKALASLDHTFLAGSVLVLLGASAGASAPNFFNKLIYVSRFQRGLP